MKKEGRVSISHRVFEKYPELKKVFDEFIPPVGKSIMILRLIPIHAGDKGIEFEYSEVNE